jgi:hypothetical protein
MQMESDRLVWLASSPWASPFHLIRKPDGFWQPCGEYRQLRDVTVPDTYPFPNMMDFSAGFVTCKFFFNRSEKKVITELCILLTFV